MAENKEKVEKNPNAKGWGGARPGTGPKVNDSIKKPGEKRIHRSFTVKLSDSEMEKVQINLDFIMEKYKCTNSRAVYIILSAPLAQNLKN
jgi:hypothetical protein